MDFSVTLLKNSHIRGEAKMMTDIGAYWKRLVSTGLRFLQEQGNTAAVAVIKNAILDVDFNNHDN